MHRHPALAGIVVSVPSAKGAASLLTLLLAALLAGALNAIAGGGSFLTFPALVHIGVAPVTANTTSAASLLPGYFGAAAALSSEIGKLTSARLIVLLVVALFGGLLGALLLLITSNKTFLQIVPWLLLWSTAMFAVGPYVSSVLARRNNMNANGILPPAMFLVSILGGYFNGGLGVIILAVLSITGMKDLPLMNSIKNLVSLVLSIIAVVTFAVAGIVDWRWAIPMMASATLGGYIGGKLAAVLPDRLVRSIVIVTGLVMTVQFFRTSP